MKIKITGKADAANSKHGLRLDLHPNGANTEILADIKAGETGAFDVVLASHNDRLTLARPGFDGTGAKVDGVLAVDNGDGATRVSVLFAERGVPEATPLLVVEPGKSGKADFALVHWCDELRVDIVDIEEE